MRFLKYLIPSRVRESYASRVEPEAQRFLGTVLWSVLVVLLILTVLLSIVFGIWEFTRPLTHEEESSVTVGQQKVISKPELQKALEALDTRAEEYTTRHSAPILVKDPS